MIVFVDHFVGFAEDVAELYSKPGYKTTSFTDPKLAFDWIRENEVDILVTDNSMSGILGTELVKKVKEIKPAIHCIIFSGDCNIKSDHAQCINKGNFNKLGKTIKTLISEEKNHDGKSR